MNKTSQYCIEQIGALNWVFDMLVPGFEFALKKRILASRPAVTDEVLSTQDITQLALLAYRPELTSNSVVNRPFGLFLDPCLFPESSVLGLMAEQTYSGGCPSSFSLYERQLITDAHRLIAQKCPDVWGYLKKYVRHYMKVANVPYRSASWPHSFGCIFVGESALQRSPVDLSISLIHELAHQELFLVNLVDRLVTSNADYNLVHAPFQGRARPPIGRLHSFYALFRMIHFVEKMDLSGEAYANYLNETYKTFEEEELTPFAKKLVDVCLNSVTYL